MTTPAEFTGISRSVMATLLAKASGYDRRFLPGEVDVEAFCEVAREWRWNSHEVHTQIKKWGAVRKPEEGMEPALLNRLIREARQDAAMRAAAPKALPAAGVFDANDGYPVGDDPAWGRNNSPELERIHEACMPFDCEYCKQSAGSRCMNRITKNGTKIPHLSRLKQAGVSGSFP